MKGVLTSIVGLAYATLHVLGGGFKSFLIFTPTDMIYFERIILKGVETTN